MTPADLRAARKALGLTGHGLAKALRMGKSGWQSVSRWEADGATIPGHVQVAVELMLERQQWVETPRVVLREQEDLQWPKEDIARWKAENAQCFEISRLPPLAKAPDDPK